MDDTGADGSVLVAVADPGRVEQLVRTASDLARITSGTVQIVSIVSKPRASPVSVYSDETIVERFAQETQAVLDRATAVAPDDVTIDREILVDHSVADGLLTAVNRADASALVIGYQEGRSRTDAILGTNIDQLTKHAPCDLYVERVGYEAGEVASILVPVAGGPHVRPAVLAAKAIAARNDATVHLFAVAESEEADSGRAAVEAALEQIEDTPGPDVRVETTVKSGTDVPDMLIRAADEHDVLVFGVTRRSSVRRRLVGSIPQEVIPRTDKTVILARSAEAVSGTRFRRLRRLWRHV